MILWSTKQRGKNQLILSGKGKVERPLVLTPYLSSKSIIGM